MKRIKNLLKSRKGGVSGVVVVVLMCVLVIAIIGLTIAPIGDNVNTAGSDANSSLTTTITDLKN